MIPQDAWGVWANSAACPDSAEGCLGRAASATTGFSENDHAAEAVPGPFLLMPVGCLPERPSEGSAAPRISDPARARWR